MTFSLLRFTLILQVITKQTHTIALQLPSGLDPTDDDVISSLRSKAETAACANTIACAVSMDTLLRRRQLSSRHAVYTPSSVSTASTTTTAATTDNTNEMPIHVGRTAAVIARHLSEATQRSASVVVQSSYTYRTAIKRVLLEAAASRLPPLSIF